jgi:AcrR family transcriptional regulator
MAVRGAARDLLVATAAEMIYRRGVSATGVDAITRESGVSKPTLYTHFRSKDELVTAALEWRHERRRRDERVPGRGGRLRDRQGALSVFDWVSEVNLASGLRGCAFLNAAVELVEESDEPALAVVRGHKAWWLVGTFARVLVTREIEPAQPARRLAAMAIRALRQVT